MNNAISILDRITLLRKELEDKRAEVARLTGSLQEAKRRLKQEFNISDAKAGWAEVAKREAKQEAEEQRLNEELTTLEGQVYASENTEPEERAATPPRSVPRQPAAASQPAGRTLPARGLRQLPRRG